MLLSPVMTIWLEESAVTVAEGFAPRSSTISFDVLTLLWMTGLPLCIAEVLLSMVVDLSTIRLLADALLTESRPADRSVTLTRWLTVASLKGFVRLVELELLRATDTV